MAQLAQGSPLAGGLFHRVDDSLDVQRDPTGLSIHRTVLDAPAGGSCEAPGALRRESVLVSKPEELELARMARGCSSAVRAGEYVSVGRYDRHDPVGVCAPDEGGGRSGNRCLRGPAAVAQHDEELTEVGRVAAQGHVHDGIGVFETAAAGWYGRLSAVSQPRASHSRRTSPACTSVGGT